MALAGPPDAMQPEALDAHEADAARLRGILDVVDAHARRAVRVAPLRLRLMRDEVELLGEEQEVAEGLEVQRPGARMQS